VDLLRVEPEETPGAFRLEGELDISNVEAVRTRLGEALGQVGQLTLDTRGISFMDAQGLRMLILLGKQAEERGATVRILDCSPQVRLLLEVTVPHGIPGVEIVNTGRTGSKGGPRGC